MKRSLSYFIVLTIFIVFNSGCQQAKEKIPPENKAVQEVEEIKEYPSVCIWDDASVRAKPTVKSQRVSALALGEKVVWLGKAELDPADNKRNYLKIRLSDGSVGWASEMAVVTGANPAAVVKEAPVCIRPDLLTVTEAKMEPMDIIAVINTEGDWLKMVGEEKVKAGWIQSEMVSENNDDIALALMARKILEEEDAKLKKEKIESILNNLAFANSTFRRDLEIKLKKLAPDEIFSHEIEKLDSGLIAYYPFSGNANDESGNDLNGVKLNAYLVADINGKVDNAYMLNGASGGGFISVNNAPDLNLGKIGSISLFINVRSHLKKKHKIDWYILGKGIRSLYLHEGYCIYISTINNNIYGVIMNRKQPISFNRISFGQPTDGVWHHLVMVWDGDFLKAYFDGKIYGRPVRQTVIPAENTDNLIIGKPSRQPEGYFELLVDQIRLYNRALTEEDIITLYKTRL
jgi:hypothetical protein